MTNKVVVITGGARGQGRTHAITFAKHGYNVVLADILDTDHPDFQETVQLAEKEGAKVLPVKTNIRKSEDVENLFNLTWETFGRIDVVIANAGVVDYGLIWDITDEQIEKVININLIGTWRTDKYAAMKMMQQGFGRIINVSSISGLNGTPTLGSYCMSKWGVMGLTKTLAYEVGRAGLIVNAICPTGVKTPMCEVQEYVDNYNRMMNTQYNDYKEMYAGGGFLEPQEVSDMIFWMADSAEAGKFTGRHIIIDNGMTP